MMLESLNTAASVCTAVVGLYVAALAYRGYRENRSPTMRVLAVGILCIAVVPYLVTLAVGPLLALTDAQVILAVTLAHTVGLAAIYRTFG